jgi:hypothetical protein
MFESKGEVESRHDRTKRARREPDVWRWIDKPLGYPWIMPNIRTRKIQYRRQPPAALGLDQTRRRSERIMNCKIQWVKMPMSANGAGMAKLIADRSPGPLNNRIVKLSSS